MNLVNKLAILVHHSFRVITGLADAVMVYSSAGESPFYGELIADHKKYVGASREAFTRAWECGKYGEYRKILREKNGVELRKG